MTAQILPHSPARRGRPPVLLPAASNAAFDAMVLVREARAAIRKHRTAATIDRHLADADGRLRAVQRLLARLDHHPQQGTNITLAAGVAHWRADLLRTHHPFTVKTHLSGIRSFMRTVGPTTPVAAISAETVARWQVENDAAHTAWSAHKYRDGFRSFMRYAERQGWR